LNLKEPEGVLPPPSPLKGGGEGRKEENFKTPRKPCELKHLSNGRKRNQKRFGK